MIKWIGMALVFGPITTTIIYLIYKWNTPERVKARKLKKISASQKQFSDW